MHAPFFFQPPQSNFWPRTPSLVVLENPCVVFVIFFFFFIYLLCENSIARDSEPHPVPPPAFADQDAPPAALPPCRRDRGCFLDTHRPLAPGDLAPTAFLRGRNLPHELRPRARRSGVRVLPLQRRSLDGRWLGPHPRSFLRRLRLPRCCRRRRCWRARTWCRRDPRILSAPRPGVPRVQLGYPLLPYPGHLLRRSCRGPLGPRPRHRLLPPPHALGLERPCAVAHVRGWHLRPHHRRLLRPCLVDVLLLRLRHRLRGRLLALCLLLRSSWLRVTRRGWPGRPPRRRGQRCSIVAVSSAVREPLSLVAGSGWHLG
ncbi:uncharacterized protein LOC119559636 isoform X1 [Drosophila subpulchrella]|uniref:uncharacterized protein LOC119559636 isoform X1 n=1 Tax=Drosophila subpulchrella TaxID=1486046 RepID=UPI0018A191F9|nr:uncharacterized protein LOC119559636 isoform X1 [Drosophila subpulchrella]